MPSRDGSEGVRALHVYKNAWTGQRINCTSCGRENALQPNHFISSHAAAEFIEVLEAVAREIEKLRGMDAGRAVQLFETFIAGCYEKANDVDDSGGYLGTFVQTLFAGWIKAREAAGADSDQTAKAILNWMDKDEYGLCNQREREIVSGSGISTITLRWPLRRGFTRRPRCTSAHRP
jgi:hypothetical protein